jgi:fused signal recognition particle receptor
VRTIDFDDYIKRAEKPAVIMFVGVNGTGKTTAIARIAYRLKNNGYSCILAAGDTFRAGAIEQLEKHAQRLDLKLIKHKAGADPAAVAFDAVEHAKARRKDVVLLDTAGRMQTNINLMDEMKKIKRVADPSMVIYVGDSLAGNDAIIQAQKFDEAVGIDGVILTKIDADAKGGAALSIAYTIGKPILFVGTGQEYPDLIPFDPEWMTARLFEE